MPTVNPTIYGRIDRWWSGCVEGFANRPKSGRPLKADDTCSLKLLEVIEKEPADLRYDFTLWTIDRLRAHLAEEWLVKQYPAERVNLVMDNASYHKRTSALAALCLFEHRVMVIWLPPHPFRTESFG